MHGRMRKVKSLKNYKSSLILLVAITIGGVLGMVMGEKASIFAPFGLGAYFASVVGQLGSQILTGYIKVFILYLVVSIVYYFVFFTLYAYIGGKNDGQRKIW